MVITSGQIAEDLATFQRDILQVEMVKTSGQIAME